MRIKLDGTGREQISPGPLLYLVSLSPDAKWAAVVVTGGAGTGSGTSVRAYPLRGGTPITLCDTCVVGFGPARTQAPSVSWSPDGKSFYVALRHLNLRMEKTAVFALKPGSSFPSANIAALRSEKDFVAAGARILDEASVFPGPEAAVYAFTRRPAQKNLFRIRLP